MKQLAHQTLYTVVVFALLTVFVSCKSHSGAQASKPRLVNLLPFEFDARNPGRKEFGALKFMSAFQLKSKDSRFGGLSGLAFGTDGKLYAVSDRGYWLSAKLVSAADGVLQDVIDWQISPMLMPDGSPAGSQWADAEALTRSRDGSFLVAFEGYHRVWRYATPPQTFAYRPTPVALPAKILRAPSNGGLEGIASLPDGRLVALTEQFANADGSFKGWLVNGNHAAELAYLPAKGFNVSDCAALANGDVLVLERRYAPIGSFTARLILVERKTIRPGAVLSGKELLKIEQPLASENYEGLAVHQTSMGTMIFLISDDNFSIFQQTLLLQFLLPNSASGAAAH